MIQPTALNLLVVGAFMIIFTFLWRAAAAQLAERPVGQAMATVL